MYASSALTARKPSLRRLAALVPCCAVIVLLGLTARAGAGSPQDEGASDTPTEAEEAPDAGSGESSGESGKDESGSGEAKASRDRARVAHVLIAHTEAEQPQPGTKLSRKEAEDRAALALAEARDPDKAFEDVVRKYSDDMQTKERGGEIGVLQRARIAPGFEALGKAVFALEPGEVSEVVESPFGFHIVKRLPIVEYAASHILVQYQGAQRAGPEIQRTEKEARQRAEEVLAEVRKEDTDFAELARTYSDGPSAERGGSLGIFLSGRMIPAFEEAVASIEEGEITGPVQTAFGFHVIRRDRVERVGARHILIQHSEAQGAGEDVQRSKEEARQEAERILALVRDGKIEFAKAAKKHSDGPSASRGGDLGLFGRSQMHPAFEKAAFGLEVGETSGPVETPFGYHLIRRTQ